MSNIPAPAQPLPYWYQKDDLTYIFNQLRAGEFCSLVGMGSTGKSNLVNLVARDDVKLKYLPREEAMTQVIVLLNPHLLISLSDDALHHTGRAWSGYEMMINRLLRKLMSPPFSPWLTDSGHGDVITNITKNYYTSLFDKLPALAQTGVRQLESAIYDVLALGDAWRVTFIFDEFEQFIAQLPPHFFQSLRGLRDEYKGRISYVTTSRRTLWEITEEVYPEERDQLVMESFVELFNGSIRYVSPLDLESANESVRRLEDRYSKQSPSGKIASGGTLPLPAQARANLIAVTGGHAGLLRRGFVPTMKNPQIAADSGRLIAELLNNRGISDECAVIIRSLSVEERRALRQLLDKQPVTDVESMQSLIDKHIIYDDGGQKFWRIPLLAGWARKHENEL
jgi:hypothetical protein